MSEMIKHGIEEANKELIQENHEKFMQEVIIFIFYFIQILRQSFC